ncbi:MAG: DUF2309 domain-containing protein [Labilithrix sp.]|nr:DUF2309 domain-containing protein [Labilithrix sp.]MCW5812628.1 DUF2309 domain-containing protein [Labilithrix sp.]
MPRVESSEIAKALADAAHFLPSQAPLDVFVHHNTLHAFQHLSFHDALAAAGAKLGGAGYLSEAAYRAAHASGRITAAALVAAIEEHAVPRLPEVRGGLPDAGSIARTVLVHGIAPETPAGLAWRIAEEGATRAVARGVSEVARGRIEREGLAALWTACRAAIRGGVEEPAPRAWFPRDALMEVGGDDPNDLVHPLLVLLAGAFLDRGQAQWSMPDREQGLFVAFCRVLSAGHAVRASWLRPLGKMLRAWLAAAATAEDAIADVIAKLGIAPDEVPAFIERALLELPGWAGMFHRVEAAEGRHGVTVRLVDFFAVRMTLDLLALLEIGRRLGHRGPAAELRAFAATLPSLRDAPASGDHDRAWPLFLLAQHLGIGAGDVGAHAPALLELLAALDRPLRLRVWHEAYEACYRDDLLDALAAQRPHAIDAIAPRFQIVTCIDDRNEGIRRHFEEASLAHETFGSPGFFNLAMAYQGIDDPSTFPLCPVVVTPHHEVHEEPVASQIDLAALRERRRRHLDSMTTGLERASHSIVWGPFVTALIGFVTALPLLVTVFAPFVAGRVRRRLESWVLPLPKTRLALPRAETDVAEGHASGFTIAEKAERVGAVLEEIGLTRRFARIVVVLGHDSSSANNPHIAAYSCGACGGRSGGPNARLFARMANRKEVRELLRARGIDIPSTTVFIGGVNDTCADRVVLHDVDEVPAELMPELSALQAALDDASKRHAHERCRRFASAPRRATAEEAWRHVEARGYDPSQARPELGHATNAACVVGRRTLTRGLFLDRRVLLSSYDPTGDVRGAVLERVLLAVGPVGAGINLEYFFSTTDNEIYGAGTKLPHNVTGLIGVMNGASSDLRTGLPRQMIEIHEPIRLQLLVEASLDAIAAVLARRSELRALVDNEWVRLAAIDPASGAIWLRRHGTFVPWSGARTEIPVVARSRDWYRGKSEHLRPARVLARESNGVDVRVTIGDFHDA